MFIITSIAISIFCTSFILYIFYLLYKDKNILIPIQIFLVIGFIMGMIAITRELSSIKTMQKGIVLSIDTSLYPNAKIECLDYQSPYVKFTNGKDTLVVTKTYWKNNIVTYGDIIDNKNM